MTTQAASTLPWVIFVEFCFSEGTFYAPEDDYLRDEIKYLDERPPALGFATEADAEEYALGQQPPIGEDGRRMYYLRHGEHAAPIYRVRRARYNQRVSLEAGQRELRALRFAEVEEARALAEWEATFG